jgi:PPOX class probable FMN-dependent enzyme
MSEWFEIFHEAVTLEWPAQPIIAAMATSNAQGIPSVRNVVCRIQGEQRFFITTDSRSQKSKHIQTSPQIELAFWLPRRREQFRIIAIAELWPDPQPIWDDLSDQTRASFYWPAPGQPLQADNFPTKPSPGRKPPPHFQVLFLGPQQVDHLELTPQPHRRRRWSSATGWKLENLNP